ncbi:hypothetical protein BKA64DRAFT_638030 [Cadophora sp. MPI-SDFR-AT-0126]|nr:hypothetical protein BKA64DRAFT_638030 [Leotiomycetes sp. MPI-SDFR-AT-0126]
MSTPRVPQQSGNAAARTGSGPVEQNEVKNTQNPVSNLAEAIFIPFKGFRSIPLSSADPLSQTQKLAKIIENVENQQALVKSNMIYLAGRRAGDAVARAEAELVDMGEGLIGEEPGALEAKREKRGEAEALMQFMRRPARKGAKKEDFTGRGSASITSNASHKQENGLSVRKSYANGGVNMSTAKLISRARSTSIIRKEATSVLQSIVMDGTTQLEAYDKLSSSTLNYYKQAQSRRTSRSDPSLPLPVRARSGNVNFSPQRAATISSLGYPQKSHKNASPRANQELRRTTTGMPISGSVFAEPVRNLETMEELARRGKK